MEAIRAPDTIYFHVTQECNLCCSYCYFSAGKSKKKELTTREALSVCENACLLNPRRVVFTGGEPLLRKDIIKLAQVFKNGRNEIILCITTNGTLINEDNAYSIVKQFNEIRISIDGFKKTNDAMRGKGTFEKVIKSFRYIINAGGNPTAFITATSLNLSQLIDFIRFLLRNRIFKIHISPLKILGRAKDKKMLCSIEEVKRIINEFLCETFGLQLRSEIKETFNCGVGKFLTVYPDGSVYPCHVLAFPELCIGNVREHSLNLIYHDSNLMSKLRTLYFDKIAQCAEYFKELSQEGTCLGLYIQDTEYKKQLLGLLKKI